MKKFFFHIGACLGAGAVAVLMSGCAVEPAAEAPTANAAQATPAGDPDEPQDAAGTAASDDNAAVTADTAADEPAADEPQAAAADQAETQQTAAPADSATPSGDRVVTGDWPMWGNGVNRNMVNETTDIAIDFEPSADPEKAKKVIWTSKLGSQTYGNPVVAGGRVFVGTNNGGEYRPQHKGDKGCVLCFDEKTGKFLWQLTRNKLETGRVNDWPLQGICSTVAVEENRVYVVTNRCELMCLDAEGFHDNNENDGEYQDETDKEVEDADIIWSLNMMDELGVFPHNLATSSPLVYQDNVYIVTSNGVDEAHLEIPSPRAPSFICVNKMTGEVVWEDSSPADGILHGQWSSPTVGVVDGRAQVYFPGGDGWLYAFDAATGEPIWKFDCNPKDAVYELGGRGTRNEIISTPVFINNSVIVAVGQDPEHGEGVGHMYRVDATKTGDVSPVLDEDGDAQGEPNPNSAQIWHYGGVDTDGSVTGKADALIFRRTISTPAVHEGLVYAADLSGRLHCIDFETGKRYWEADLLSAIWGSPMVADGKVFLGDEDGDLSIFAVGKEEKKLAEITFPSSVYSTPTIANGVLFVSDRSRLYAIQTQ